MAKGRGRLSRIDLLGSDYDDIVMWAAGQLRQRDTQQNEICAEFNDRLKARAEEIGDDEFKPISTSSFNRYSVSLAETMRRVERTREISRILVDRLDPADSDKTTIVIADLIKSAIEEQLREAGEGGTSLKDLKFAGDALRSADVAKKQSADRRLKLQEEAKRQAEAMANEMAKKAVDAVEKAAVEAGLSKAAVAQLRRDFLGIRPAKPVEDAGPAKPAGSGS